MAAKVQDKEQPKEKEKGWKDSFQTVWIARDRAGGLIGIYGSKPREVNVKDRSTQEQTTYFHHSSLLMAIPAITFHQLFQMEIGLGECYAATLDLQLVV